MVDALRDLATDLIDPRGGVLVVTGAGVSLASGIPTFRGTDAGAVWAKDTTRLGTFAYFSHDPVGSWTWYLSRFEKVLGASPNAAHRALVQLEEWHRTKGHDFLLVTQNVDGLHRAAGSKALVEVHGRADRFRCAREGCELGAPAGSIPRGEVDLGPFLASPSKETLPRCSACGTYLRQHVLWFDETYTIHTDYQFERVLAAAARARVVIFAGTSFAVGITEIVLESARDKGAHVYSIDPTLRASAGFVRPIASPAEEALPALARMVAGDLGES